MSATSDGRREQPRRVSRGAIVTAIVLLLLLLFGTALMWPVPGAGRSDVASDLRSRSAGGPAVTIESVAVSGAEGVRVGSKGHALLVDVSIGNASSARAFDPNWLTLEVDGLRVPPLGAAHEGVARLILTPQILAEHSRTRAVVVFAAPRGSEDATLALAPGELRIEEADSRALRIPSAVSR